MRKEIKEVIKEKRDEIKELKKRKKK